MVCLDFENIEVGALLFYHLTVNTGSGICVNSITIYQIIVKNSVAALRYEKTKVFIIKEYNLK